MRAPLRAAGTSYQRVYLFSLLRSSSALPLAVILEHRGDLFPRGRAAEVAAGAPRWGHTCGTNAGLVGTREGGC